MCQDPIEGMEILFEPAETSQDHLFAPEIYIRTSEILNIKILTTKGLPILYNVSFDEVIDASDTIDTEGKYF